MADSPGFTADFDSSTAMVRALSRYLRGADFPALGLNRLLQIPASQVNLLPPSLRKLVYLTSGWLEAFPSRKLAGVDGEDIGRWIEREYPNRRYPAVAIGSANGAAVHLCAAAGIPWLPQTFLIPVRQSVDPEDAGAAMEMGIEPGRRLLAHNPDLQLHHMHDANQDRLMVRTMTYFRVKRRRLGASYRRFLEERLPPGGTIIVCECELTWGVTRIGDRHVFQHGAVGGATEEEFHEGGPRVAEHLEGVGSHRTRWPGPDPEERAPEAEWGFEPALLDDIRRLAAERHYRIVRLRFPTPESLSPPVADLYRRWYRQRNVPSSRLLAESFILLDPHWALKTGSVPFWMVFNMQPSLDALHDYLDRAGPFDHIRMMLFNHGAQSVGLPDAAEWEGALARARLSGDWLGSDPSAFPTDFAQFARYNRALRRIPARYAMPGPLDLERLWAWLGDGDETSELRIEHEGRLRQTE